MQVHSQLNRLYMGLKIETDESGSGPVLIKDSMFNSFFFEYINNLCRAWSPLAYFGRVSFPVYMDSVVG